MSDTGVAGAASTTGPDGLTADEVAQRVRAGRVNVADERTSRTLQEILARQRSHPVQRDPRHHVRAHPRVRRGPGRALRLRPVVQRAHRCRAGVPREADPRPARGSARAPCAGRARRRRPGGARDRGRPRRSLRPRRRRPGFGRRRVARGRGSRGRRVDADGRVRPGGQGGGRGGAVGQRRRRGPGTLPSHSGRDPTRTPRRLATEARRFTLTRSELMDGINRILQYVQWALVPTAVLLAFSQFNVQHTTHAAIAGVVAGVVAMVPEGLVLLTSLAFGVAAMTLARRQVLVQELPAVEGLARVDVILLDKTGTLTEGVDQVPRGARDRAATIRSPTRWARSPTTSNRNATMNALCEAFPAPTGWSRTGATPFSSGRKWSGVTFGDRGTWVLGAPEMVWAERADDSGPRRRRPARGRRSAGALARAHRRRAGRRRPARRVARVGASACSRSRSDPTPPRRSNTSRSRASGA